MVPLSVPSDPFVQALALAQAAGLRPLTPRVVPHPGLYRALPTVALRLANARSTALGFSKAVADWPELTPPAPRDLIDALAVLRAAAKPRRGNGWWRAWRESWQARQLETSRPVVEAVARRAQERAARLAHAQQALAWVQRGLTEWLQAVGRWSAQYPEHAELLQAEGQQLNIAQASLAVVAQRLGASVAAEAGLSRRAAHALALIDAVRKAQGELRAQAWAALEQGLT